VPLACVAAAVQMGLMVSQDLQASVDVQALLVPVAFLELLDQQAPLALPALQAQPVGGALLALPALPVRLAMLVPQAQMALTALMAMLAPVVHVVAWVVQELLAQLGP